MSAYVQTVRSQFLRRHGVGGLRRLLSDVILLILNEKRSSVEFVVSVLRALLHLLYIVL